MSVATWTGIVENGQIRLADNVRLPEKAVVYVVVPNAAEIGAPAMSRILSPRLANPQDAAHFIKTVVLEADDASL